MVKIKHITDKHGEIVYPISKEGAIYDDNGVLLSSKISTFITRLVDNLANYYLKSELYTKEETDTLIGAIQGFSYIVVSELPIASAFTMGTIYLVPSEDPQTQNVKDEYITIRSGSIGSYTYSWEQIGSTAIDLSGYVTTEALNTELAKYTTTANLTTLLAGKQDTIADLASIRSGASLGATAYQKPNSGIPASDIAAGVIPDISGKQDVIPDLSTIRSGAAAGATAYQKPSGGIPKTDLESGVQDSLDLADSAVQADPVGSVTPPVTPSDWATAEQVEELEHKVGEISGQFYGVFASASALPSGITVKGYAYVGSEEPFELYTFDGTSWTDTESTVEGVHFIDNELSIGTVVEGNTADALLTGDAPNQILNLTIPRAGNPFKGMFPDFASLKASGNATEGDYAYVQDASPATTASIYRYDSTASSNNYWADSGIDTDFGSPIVVPFTEYAKNTILYVMSKVAWINQNGQDYLDLLHDALLLKNVVSVEATFTQGTDYFGTNSAIDELKADLVVVATYDDASTRELGSHEYALSGTLTHGTSTITVTYQGKTDTFTVNVVSYVLEKSQFVCYGLTNVYNSNSPYPYINDNYINRFSYPFFDLFVTGGKTYLFTIISSVSTVNIGVQGLTQTQLDAVAAHNNFGSPTDSGWQNYPSFTYQIPADNVLVRVTGRKDSSNPDLTEVPIERLIIDEQ